MMKERENPLSKKMSLDEWIIDLHRKKGKLRFTDVVNESVSYFGDYPDTDEKHELIAHYRKLIIKDRKLKYDGMSYLPS